MAKYTMELRDVLKCASLFDFSYPFYDEKKRHEFETAFVRHFYFREICCPNIERFKIYLEDKFATVFPYYNELMKTATIQYSLENPYNLTETYTRDVDSVGKANSGSFTVEQTEHSESGESNAESERNTTATQDGSSTTNGTVTDSNTRTTDTNGGSNQESSEKFLDTPQGLVDLSDNDYVTNLKHNTTENTNNEHVEETTGGTKTEEVNGSTESNSTGKETQTGKTTAQSSGEQRSRLDNNARSENIGKQKETYTLTRKGNIGVNPASYEIDAHIVTQKTLKRIEEMFFNECEDLFMLVY